MAKQKRESNYFKVISRIDGFEVGVCLNEYYVRHPRGLIDWLHMDLDAALSSLIDDVPRDVVGRIREVLEHEAARSPS